jgi:hypothetical protein
MDVQNIGFQVFEECMDFFMKSYVDNHPKYLILEIFLHLMLNVVSFEYSDTYSVQFFEEYH